MFGDIGKSFPLRIYIVTSLSIWIKHTGIRLLNHTTCQLLDEHSRLLLCIQVLYLLRGTLQGVWIDRVLMLHFIVTQALEVTMPLQIMLNMYITT